MAEFTMLSLALWIVTHTIAIEIPLTAKASKPFSCQLCLSGWLCLFGAFGAYLQTGDLWLALVAVAIWAASVLIEAAYNRLRIVVL